jgi:hypothetical protein
MTAPPSFPTSPFTIARYFFHDCEHSLSAGAFAP